MSSIKCAPAVMALVVCASLCSPAAAQGSLTADPVSAPQIQASFEHYQAGDFGLSLKASHEALRLNPESAIAYNNICCAKIRLGAYDEAIEACNRALEIVPEYRLAYGNLIWAYSVAAKNEPSVENFLGLSVLRYWNGELEASLEASRRVLELDPTNALAHNNICAAHAEREEWDAAIEACEKAISLDPALERAQNNLAWAQSGRAGEL